MVMALSNIAGNFDESIRNIQLYLGGMLRDRGILFKNSVKCIGWLVTLNASDLCVYTYILNCYLWPLQHTHQFLLLFSANGCLNSRHIPVDFDLEEADDIFFYCA